MNALTTINTTTNTNTTLTMSSREIAELTGKRHGDVIRDIRNTLEQLWDNADLRHVVEAKDARGYTAHFSLPKDLTITLVSGYNVQMRYAITKRWMELEEQAAKPAIPQNFVEALRLAAEIEEQRQALLLENEAMKPAADLGNAVGKLKNVSVSEFAKKLHGVNANQVSNRLGELGYLYKDFKGKWAVRSQYRDVLFAVKTGERTQGAFTTIIALEKGQQLLVKLYNEASW